MWNYRLVKKPFNKNGYKGFSYEVHEVYYDGEWKEEAMTESPIAAVEQVLDENIDETSDEAAKESVIRQLEMMIKDIENYGIFEPPKKWLKE